MNDRLTKLLAILERQPDDTFVLYALALEHKKLGKLPEALDYLARVVKLDPGHCYAYHQCGLIHEMTGDLPAARRAYQAGIAAASQKADTHARKELELALDGAS